MKSDSLQIHGEALFEAVLSTVSDAITVIDKDLTLQNGHSEEQITEMLGISRKNLWEKRKRWDLHRSEKPV
jgi:hypothetical protein